MEDGATRLSTSRVIHLRLDEDILRLIDAEYDIMAQEADAYAIEKSRELARMESILGAGRPSPLCEDMSSTTRRTAGTSSRARR